MGFWKNVKEFSEYKNTTRKELATLSGVPKSTIDKGFERDSDVQAVVALKISYALNIPLETLLGIDINNSHSKKNLDKLIRLAEKYSHLLKNVEKMNPEKRERFIAMSDDLTQ